MIFIRSRDTMYNAIETQGDVMNKYSSMLKRAGTVSETHTNLCLLSDVRVFYLDLSAVSPYTMPEDSALTDGKSFIIL